MFLFHQKKIYKPQIRNLICPSGSRYFPLEIRLLRRYKREVLRSCFLKSSGPNQMLAAHWDYMLDILSFQLMLTVHKLFFSILRADSSWIICRFYSISAWISFAWLRLKFCRYKLPRPNVPPCITFRIAWRFRARLGVGKCWWDCDECYGRRMSRLF